MPLDTILLLDTSGSMAGCGIRELKRACSIFFDGVEETARQTGLKENVGIVEFNSSARIVLSLTNDYQRCRRAVSSLNAGGTTAMFDGLMNALKEVMTNGGILRISGIAMTPRIILMTDGQPTDTAGVEEAKKKVLAAALGFGPGWKECGLPHPVPIACVGCGDCDAELLQVISKLTKGMYVIVNNVSELSTFFKRQVLLIRFAAQFASDMERLRSQAALAAFLSELGEAVELAELIAMRQLLLAMLMAAADDDDDPAPSRPTGSVASRPSGALALPAPPQQQRTPTRVASGTSGASAHSMGTSVIPSRPQSSQPTTYRGAAVARQVVVVTRRESPPLRTRPQPPPERRSGDGCSVQ